MPSLLLLLAPPLQPVVCECERQSTVNFTPSSFSDLNMDWPRLCLAQLATSASQTLNENFFLKGCTREHFTELCGTKLGLVGAPVEHCSSQNCFAWTLLSCRRKKGKQSFLDMFLKSVRSLQWHVFLIVVMFYSLPVRNPVLALETCKDLDLSIFVRNWIICHFSAAQVMLVSSKYFLICT